MAQLPSVRLPSDSRQSGCRQSDSRKGDSRQSDSRKSDSRQSDSRQSGCRQSDSRQSGCRQSDSRLHSCAAGSTAARTGCAPLVRIRQAGRRDRCVRYHCRAEASTRAGAPQPARAGGTGDPRNAGRTTGRFRDRAARHAAQRRTVGQGRVLHSLRAGLLAAGAAAARHRGFAGLAAPQLGPPHAQRAQPGERRGPGRHRRLAGAGVHRGPPPGRDGVTHRDQPQRGPDGRPRRGGAGGGWRRRGGLRRGRPRMGAVAAPEPAPGTAVSGAGRP